MQSKRKLYFQIAGICIAAVSLLFFWKDFIGIIRIVCAAAAPLLLGCVLAYILNILVRFYEEHLFQKWAEKRKKSIPRLISIVLSVVTVMSVFVLIVTCVIPELISGIRLLGSSIESGVVWVKENIEHNDAFDAVIEKWFGNETGWEENISKVVDILLSGASSIIGVFSSAISGIVTFAIALIFAIYLLMGKERLKQQIHSCAKAYLPQKTASRIYHVVQIFDSSFHHYIVGQCVEAVILGLLCTIGMLLLGLPYAPVIGSVVGATALIPIAGAYIGGAVGAFLILMVSPMKAVIFLVFLIILQQLEGNLIYPRVVGTSIGLPGMWVLAAVTIGGGIAGIPGVLLVVPIVSALYQLLKQDVQKRLLPDKDESQEIQKGNA